MQKNPIYYKQSTTNLASGYKVEIKIEQQKSKYCKYIRQNLLICQMDFEHILDDLFLQLNECRLHPRETSHNLTQLRNSYQGHLFKNKYKTREGQRALDNLIQDLAQRPPANKRLKWSFALHMAADEQAAQLGQRGIYTTEGTYSHKTLPQRVKDYAIIKGRLCQVYEFGGITAQQILQQLLIDDGLTSRKRRNILLDPIFNYIGIGSSFHEKTDACTVIILAEDIVSLVAPDSNGKYKKRTLPTGIQTAIKHTEQIILNQKGLPIPPPLNQNTVPQNQNSNLNLSNSQINQPSFILPQPGRQSQNVNNYQSQMLPKPGETVTYTNNNSPGFNSNFTVTPPPNNPGLGNFTSDMNNLRGSNVTNVSNMGDTVTYNNAGTIGNQSVNLSGSNALPINNNNLSNQSVVGPGQTVSYASPSQSQLQQQQYEIYKDPNPTPIPINNTNSLTNSNVQNPSLNIGHSTIPQPVTPPKKESSSRCAIM